MSKRRDSLVDLSVAASVFQAERRYPALTERVRRESLLAGANARCAVALKELRQVAEELGCDLERGLSRKAAAAALKKAGPNTLLKAEGRSVSSIVLEQINFLNTIVLITGVLCLMKGRRVFGYQFGKERDTQNGAMIVGIWFGCVTVGAILEWWCAWVMADLSSTAAPSCKVIRDGEVQAIDTVLVVPGDLVVLASGDILPADCRVAAAADLRTSEAALTGEPQEVPKTMVPEDPTSPFPSNMLYATTAVVGGSGRAIVVKTGMDTEIGQIAKELQVETAGLTQVQVTLNAVGIQIAVIVSVLVGLLFFISVYMRVNDPADPCQPLDDECFWRKSASRALFAAVGSIPETLQPMCMLLLVAGMLQMQRKNASCRRIDAVDTLGSCSFICSDKTGTLTEGRMTAVSLHIRLRSSCAEAGSGPASSEEAARPPAPSPLCGGPGEAPERFAFFPARGFDPAGGIWDAKALTEAARVALDERPRGERGPLSSPALEDFGDPCGTSLGARAVRTCLAAACLQCYATTVAWDADAGAYELRGNMSEGALVVAAAKARLDGGELRERCPRLEELEVPFSSERKLMATVHRIAGAGVADADHRAFEGLLLESGQTHLVVVKGTPAVVLPWLTGVLGPAADATRGVGLAAVAEGFGEEEKAWFQAENAAMAARGLRVLSVCARGLGAQDVDALCRRAATAGRGGSGAILDALLGGGLALLGLVGIADPPRASARIAVRQCLAAGVRVAMITGDQRATASAIARDLGILPEPAAAGREDASLTSDCAVLRGCSLDEIDDLCRRVRVWSSAQPGDKGHVVAMTGDGTNDAGALKRANIGIAMGITGTDVAKGAADIVLMDDRFATVVDAIAEGRRIFQNIQRMAVYLLCGNVCDVIAIMFIMLLGWAIPLETTQLFKAQFITHFFYPMCIVFERSSFYTMLQPPRSRRKQLVPGLVSRILIPVCLSAYTGGLLLAQYVGSVLYVGAVSLHEQMGTDSISEFYDESKSFVCLYANTLDGSSASGRPSSEVYVRDQNPLHCQSRRLQGSTWISVEQWGNGHTPDFKTSLRSGDFDAWSASWRAGRFSLERSFLCDSFNAKVRTFEHEDWSDPHGWLVKCDKIFFKMKDDESARGSSDKLCWRQCGDAPCWTAKSPQVEVVVGSAAASSGPEGSDERSAALERRTRSPSVRSLRPRPGILAAGTLGGGGPSAGGPTASSQTQLRSIRVLHRGGLAFARRRPAPSLAVGALAQRSIDAWGAAADVRMSGLGRPQLVHSDPRVARRHVRHREALRADELVDKPVLPKRLNAAAWGCRQMRSMVVVAMVLMQMAMLFALARHELSIVSFASNLSFPLSWASMLSALAALVYTPAFWADQGFAPLDAVGLSVCIAVAATFYAVVELAKAVHRKRFCVELTEKVALAELLAEGRVRAFCSRSDAFAMFPERRPSPRIGGQEGQCLGSCV